MKKKISENASKFLGLIESPEDAQYPINEYDGETTSVKSLLAQGFEEMTIKQMRKKLSEEGTSLKSQAEQWRDNFGLDIVPETRFFDDGSMFYILLKGENGLEWLPNRYD